jgi:hypothetical protein
MDTKQLKSDHIPIYEREIKNLKREMLLMAKKGHHQYADSIYARVHYLEMTLRTKKIL